MSTMSSAAVIIQLLGPSVLRAKKMQCWTHCLHIPGLLPAWKAAVEHEVFQAINGPIEKHLTAQAPTHSMFQERTDMWSAFVGQNN